MRSSRARFGGAGLGEAWLGDVRPGRVGSGLAWRGEAGSGRVRFCWVRWSQVWQGKGSGSGSVLPFPVPLDKVRHGLVR